MALQALGKVTVGTAGTPVAVSPAASAVPPLTPDGTTGFATVQSVMLQALPTNTGKIYIGLKGLNSTTLANCLVILPAPSDAIKGPFTSASFSQPFVPAGVNLSDMVIDADNSGEGVIVSAAYS